MFLLVKVKQTGSAAAVYQLSATDTQRQRGLTSGVSVLFSSSVRRLDVSLIFGTSLLIKCPGYMWIRMLKHRKEQGVKSANHFKKDTSPCSQLGCVLNITRHMTLRHMNLCAAAHRNLPECCVRVFPSRQEHNSDMEILNLFISDAKVITFNDIGFINNGSSSAVYFFTSLTLSYLHAFIKT